MQSNDDLYSTDTNPVNTSNGGYDQGQSGTTTPGKSDQDAHKIMPIAGANETDTDDDKKTDDAETNTDNNTQDDDINTDDVEDDDAETGTDADTHDDNADTGATMTNNFEDKTGVY